MNSAHLAAGLFVLAAILNGMCAVLLWWHLNQRMPRARLLPRRIAFVAVTALLALGVSSCYVNTVRTPSGSGTSVSGILGGVTHVDTTGSSMAQRCLDVDDGSWMQIRSGIQARADTVTMTAPWASPLQQLCVAWLMSQFGREFAVQGNQLLWNGAGMGMLGGFGGMGMMPGMVTGGFGWPGAVNGGFGGMGGCPGSPLPSLDGTCGLLPQPVMGYRTTFVVGNVSSGTGGAYVPGSAGGSALEQEVQRLRGDITTLMRHSRRSRR